MDQWQSEQINELVGAIVKAQLAMVPASKDHVNPYFKSKYADLPSCWEAVACFRENGIAITQSPMEGPDGFVLLDTQLSHVSGQWMRSRLKIRIAKDDPQGYGSAITYARRYALGCMTGLVTEEDDDGNAASHPVQQARSVTQYKQTAQAKIAELRREGAASGSSQPDPATPASAGTLTPPASTEDSPAFIWRVGAKHKGESIRTIPDDYLTWFAENGKAPDHVQAANEEIDRRMGQSSADYAEGEAQA